MLPAPEYKPSSVSAACIQLRQVSRAGGSTRGALTCGFLKDYRVPLPPIGEQRRIARVLAALDRKAETEAQQELAFLALFESLLHHLMTGKVRVHELVKSPAAEVA